MSHRHWAPLRLHARHLAESSDTVARDHGVVAPGCAGGARQADCCLDRKIRVCHGARAGMSSPSDDRLLEQPGGCFQVILA